MVDGAIEVIKESPTSYQNRITHIGNKKEGGLYRFRMPGCYILYVVALHDDGDPASITLTNIKVL